MVISCQRSASGAAPLPLRKRAWRWTWWGWGLAASALAAETAPSSTEEFAVTRGDVTVHVRVQSPPPDRLAVHPRLLLFFSGDRQSAMPDGRYGGPGRAFLEQGHRVASFDLPAHGERSSRHGGGLAGLAAMVAAGEAPFDAFIADGRAVIDACLQRGLAEPGGVFAAGVSRGGYCALRLAAADHRIAGVAALAPVTDWRELAEFAAGRSSPALAALALTNFAAPLAGRRLYVAIGNRDSRVGTDACARFVAAVLAEERAKPGTAPGLRFLIVDDSAGHALSDRWRDEGIAFLLRTPTADASGKLP